VIKDQTCCLTGVSADRMLPITGIRKGMQAELTSNSFFFSDTPACYFTGLNENLCAPWDTHEFARETAGTDHAVAVMKSEEYPAYGEQLMLLRHLPGERRGKRRIVRGCRNCAGYIILHQPG
jgi:hypothetical protein